MAELITIAAYDPFERGEPAGDARSVYIAFLDRRPTREAAQRLIDLTTEDDTFAVAGREAYWPRRGGIGTSRFSGGFLADVFASQADRHWFSRETFVGLVRVRGVECRAVEGYAEGFHARKVVW